jgi:hypothetical protein
MGQPDAAKDIVRVEANGFKYRGKWLEFTCPSQFSGARIDWWDSTKQQKGSSYPGQKTPPVGEATLWIADCNP